MTCILSILAPYSQLLALDKRSISFKGRSHDETRFQHFMLRQGFAAVSVAFIVGALV